MAGQSFAWQPDAHPAWRLDMIAWCESTKFSFASKTWLRLDMSGPICRCSSRGCVLKRKVLCGRCHLVRVCWFCIFLLRWLSINSFLPHENHVVNFNSGKHPFLPRILRTRAALCKLTCWAFRPSHCLCFYCSVDGNAHGRRSAPPTHQPISSNWLGCC